MAIMCYKDGADGGSLKTGRWSLEIADETYAEWKRGHRSKRHLSSGNDRQGD